MCIKHWNIGGVLLRLISSEAERNDHFHPFTIFSLRPPVDTVIRCVHLIGETHLATTRSSSEQTFPLPPPLLFLLLRLLHLLPLPPRNPCPRACYYLVLIDAAPRKTKSAIDNCKEYTAATVSIGVSSTPLVPRDKETHSLEQYNFF